MKINNIIKYAISIIIAVIVCLFTFKEIVRGTVRATRNDSLTHEVGNGTASGTAGLDALGRTVDIGQGGAEDLGTGCVETGKGEWDCTDVKTYRVIKKYLEWKEPAKDTLKSVITWYSRADSCHNPKWVKGKKLCLTAIGLDTKEGRTVACPRDIKLGTKIRINGKDYVCEDRYSTYLDAQRGLPTFDIFHEKNPGWGKTVSEVEILN
ncbi:MAG: hypothetical protein WC551_02765 [Patescibacteria group bacterium]